MKEAIDNNGNIVEVAKGTPTKLNNGKRYLLSSTELQEFNDRKDAWDAGANAREWTKIRNERKRLLRESDWTQLGDSLKKDQQDIKDYRQALRDITDQADPFNITWPTKPEGI